MTNEELLRDEYLAIQKSVEDFDAKALTIKAWSVTLSAAGLAAAYVEKQPVVLLVAAASALVFWLVEALWKASQTAYYPRMDEIEHCFREGLAAATPPFQISTSRARTLGREQKEMRALRGMIWPHVSFPHLPIIAIGLLLYAFAPPAMDGQATDAATVTPPPSEAPR